MSLQELNVGSLVSSLTGFIAGTIFMFCTKHTGAVVAASEALFVAKFEMCLANQKTRDTS